MAAISPKNLINTFSVKVPNSIYSLKALEACLSCIRMMHGSLSTPLSTSSARFLKDIGTDNPIVTLNCPESHFSLTVCLQGLDEGYKDIPIVKLDALNKNNLVEFVFRVYYISEKVGRQTAKDMRSEAQLTGEKLKEYVEDFFQDCFPKCRNRKESLATRVSRLEEELAGLKNQPARLG